jgi:hypothetical protein
MSKLLYPYVKCKHTLQTEGYLLLIDNADHSKKITRFRISCLQLIIETGNYKKMPLHL